jgi:hypothetical protein
MTVQANQSLFDIAVQEKGSVFAAFDLAVANDIAVTDDLTPGDVLQDIQTAFVNVDVAAFFKGKKQSIATVQAYNEPDDYSLPGGELPMSL